MEGGDGSEDEEIEHSTTLKVEDRIGFFAKGGNLREWVYSQSAGEGVPASKGNTAVKEVCLCVL